MKYPSLDMLYPRLIKSVLENGKAGAAPRGQKVIELYNVGWKILDARKGIINNPIRKFNLAYAAIEMFGNFQDGERNVEPFSFYCPPIAKYLNPKTNLWDGSYATRLMMYDQLPKMYQILKEDSDSRRAVMAMYNPAHDFHEEGSNDICCTLSLIFRLRDGKLHLSVTMRSNDVFLGLPYDLTQFTFLQNVLATWLGVEMGEYYHWTANLHAYERDLPRLNAIADGEQYDEGSQLRQVMQPWDIKSIDETFLALFTFFQFEKGAREALFEDPNTDTDALMDHFNIKSAFIRNTFNHVIKPHIIKKLSK